jgi:hypothetical protein
MTLSQIKTDRKRKKGRKNLVEEQANNKNVRNEATN